MVNQYILLAYIPPCFVVSAARLFVYHHGIHSALWLRAVGFGQYPQGSRLAIWQVLIDAAKLDGRPW